MTDQEDGKIPKAEYEHLQDLYKVLKPVMGVAGLFSPKMKAAFEPVKAAMAEFEGNQISLVKFADHYGPQGWIAYDGISAPLLKDVSDQSLDIGQARLIDHFLDDQNLERLGWRFRGDRYGEWLTIFDTVKERLLTEDFISAVPLIQIIIDGCCQKHLRMSPYSGGADAVVFGKLVEQKYLVEAFRIHGRKRKKINIDPLETPYRNGIMHGCDTNFGNALTAAKAINLLQATLEYLDARLVESDAIQKAREEQTPPKLRDLADQISNTEKMRKATDAWQPRDSVEFSHAHQSGYRPSLEPSTPEAKAHAYIEALIAENYGALGELTVNIRDHTPGKHIHEIKSRLEGFVLDTGHVSRVIDTAAALSKVEIHIRGSFFGRVVEGNVELIMNCLDPDGKPQVRGVEPFDWKVHPISFNNLLRA